MQKKTNKNLLSFILSTMLIVAMAFSMTACGNDKAQNEGITEIRTETAADAKREEAVSTESTVVGEGAVVFDFVVVDGEGVETRFEVHTDKATVGEALLEAGLIAGEEGEFGLYVKMVNGITADYDVDGTFWAFYVNGEMAMTGVDATDVAAGDTYSFKVE